MNKVTHIPYLLEILSHLKIPQPSKCHRMFLSIIPINAALEILSHGKGSADIYLCACAYTASEISLYICMYNARAYTYIVTDALLCGEISRAAFTGIGRNMQQQGGNPGPTRFLGNTVCMYASNFNNSTCTYRSYGFSVIAL